MQDNAALTSGVFVSRLPDLRVQCWAEQFTAELFAVSRDGKQYAFEFCFNGEQHRSSACFHANELAELVAAAESLLREVIDSRRLHAEETMSSVVLV